MAQLNGFTGTTELVLMQRRATSGPRARSGPRRPSVRPATLLDNNIAIRPAKPQPSVVASLMNEFASRFAGVRPLAADFKLFTAPFDFPVDDDAPVPLQMELVELQCNDEPKAKFYKSSPLSFFFPSRNFP